MRYRYFICDVFTDTRFGGNQLAVLPEATGLTDGQMQQVAREFNFAETTFVLPAERGHTRRVRIFTPAREVPFAGHPNVGTAFALATAGLLGPIDGTVTVTFEELAGLVPVVIDRSEAGGAPVRAARPRAALARPHRPGGDGGGGAVARRRGDRDPHASSPWWPRSACRS